MSDFARRRLVMVDNQVRPADVTAYAIVRAMLDVPREVFVPDGREESAYMGENLDLGGRRVIFDPRTFSKMLDFLALRADELVCVIGANHGYSAAVLSRIVETVIAVEEDADMARDAEAALTDEGVVNAVVVTAPLTEGAPQHGPYDCILIEGAVEVIPDAILDQIAEGGRIAALFDEERLGVARIGYKVNGAMNWRYAFNAGAPVLPGFERHEVFAL